MPHVLQALAALALVMTSCTAVGDKARGVTPAPNATPPRLYVAIGASDTRGIGTADPLRQAWPQDLFRTLPANYRLVNLGVPNATLSDALAEELPTAQDLHPALVTVWLNANDLLGGVPTATYQAELSSLVHSLRVMGATVLVANTPPLDHLPAYLACANPVANPGGCPPFVPRPVPSPQKVVADVERYNTAIATVVAREGAVLVDLHQSVSAFATNPALLSTDGFHPNAAGAAMIASQFAAAVPK